MQGDVKLPNKRGMRGLTLAGLRQPVGKRIPAAQLAAVGWLDTSNKNISKEVYYEEIKAVKAIYVFIAEFRPTGD